MPGSATSLNRPIAALIGQARRTLGVSQRELGELLGASRRTAARWEWGHSELSVSNACDLARRVHPHDPALASELAAAASQTLESLGLLVSTPPPRALVVDAVVCVAAEVLGMAPGAVRGALHAAFKRTRELQLSLEDVEAALAPAPAPGKASKASARS
jgi:DNA-binding XRE family transcriptional regulator